MIDDLDRARNSLLDGSSKVVAGAGGYVSDPSGDDRPRTSGSDEDIEEHVRDRSNQRELAALLANELVPRGEGHESFEPRAHHHRASVRHVARKRLAKRDKLRQAYLPLQTGLRFSRKASRPSSMSSVAASSSR